MFAVIKTGGKQYKVAENDEIIIEKLTADAGDQVTFDEVLVLGADGQSTIGAPFVAGASVVGEVAAQRKGDKVIIMKKRQRSTYRRKKGHRQHETVVKITSILADGKKAPAKAAVKAETAPKVEKAEAAPAKEAAPKAAPAKAAGADDLTKLKGVGKVFAEKLQGAGITSFQQIADLDAAGIEALEEQLNISGRVERDGWVEQAAELAKDA